MERNELNARKILQVYQAEIAGAACSKSHHLNVKGGLLIHLKDVLAVAKEYFPYDQDLHFLALLHDIGKARTYKTTETGFITYATPDVDHTINTIVMLERAGVVLSPEELNSLQFHHGGYSKFDGQPGELAMKLHFCDNLATVRETQGKCLKE